MTLPIPFTILLGLTVLSRLIELMVSHRNLRALKRLTEQRGGTWKHCESGAAYAQMVAIHLLLLVAPALECAYFDRRASLPVFLLAASLWSCGQILRWWSIAALGVAWNVRGAVSSVQTIVHTGLYSRIRHPNYLGVLLEGVALPLAGAAWVSLAFLNLLLVPITLKRLRAEERLLAELPAWRDSCSGNGLLLPRLHS